MEHRDYSGAIRWLLEHDVPPAVIADLFGKAEASIRPTAWRDAQGFIPKKTQVVLDSVAQSGLRADKTLKDAIVDEQPLLTHPLQIEEEVEQFGKNFWGKVNSAKGAAELGRLLRKVNKVSEENIRLMRAGARLYHLLSEIYLHSGCCRSALYWGSRAYEQEERVYRQTLAKRELFTIAKTCLLISHAFILQTRFADALPWLKRSHAAFTAGGLMVDPEYNRQLGVVQFSQGNREAATQNFERAGNLLPIYTPTATEAHYRDVGERFLNYVGNDEPDWEEAFTLMEYAMKAWPEGDLHKASNVNWAAGAALSIDSPEANKKALELLRNRSSLANGYYHQETVAQLLLLTPHVPKEFRKEWVWFSFHHSAFRNK